MISNKIVVILLSALISCGACADDATGASLSVGTIKTNLEQSGVRVLAKYGDSLALSDKLNVKKDNVKDGRSSFNIVSREFKVDATDDGKFGGINFRYGLQYYNIGVKEVVDAPGVPPGVTVIKFDGGKWMHVFPVNIGIDSDRNFRNRDYLIEAGYIPAKLSQSDSCFKLGANPIIALVGQAGYRKRAPINTPDNLNGEDSGELLRVKAEAKIDFALNCIVKSPTVDEAKTTGALDLMLLDLSQWRIMATTTAWHDFTEHKSYDKHNLTLRIPLSAKTFTDLKREVGQSPTNFDTGSSFSANLTIEF